MSRTLIRAGYDFTRKYTFKLDGSAENLSAATIRACVKNVGKTATLIASTSQANSGGADWANGVVVLAFPASATSSLTAQDAWVEVQVTLGGIKLLYEDIPITIEAGYL